MTLYLLDQPSDWVFAKNEIYEKVYEEERNYDIDNIIFCLIYNLKKDITRFQASPIY